jgi:hypothetical protein
MLAFSLTGRDRRLNELIVNNGGRSPANTVAPCVIIGERAAEALRNEHRLETSSACLSTPHLEIATRRSTCSGGQMFGGGYYSCNPNPPRCNGAETVAVQNSATSCLSRELLSQSGAKTMNISIGVLWCQT